MIEVQRAKELKQRVVDLGKRRRAIALLFGGCLAVCWGIMDASIARQLRRRGLTAEGTVLRNVREMDSNTGRPYWMPVIAFTDAAGNRVEFSPEAYGTGMSISTGSTVEVIYLPEDSQNVRVNKRAYLSGPLATAVIVGLFFQTIITTIIVVFARALLA